MEYVKSCGAVVFTHKDGETHYVIIRAHNGEYGFPKGHMEPGETELETALREIAEEVGLKPAFVTGFRKEIQYEFPSKPNLTKIAVYYLAEFSDQSLTIQPEEVSIAYLLPFDAAHQLLSFPETKSVLEQAHDYLRSSS